MLFTQHVNTLNSGITAIQNRIDELEAILKGLRNDKSNLEAELQTVLTLEGAAESALSQSQSFINAAESLGRYDLIETFWSALDVMQNGAIAILPETPETDATPESEPVNPIEPDTDTITVEATPEAETKTDPTPEQEAINTEARVLASVGSAAFNPSTADFDSLKTWVRSHQGDDVTRKQGTLTRRSTWEYAAKSILSNNS